MISVCPKLYLLFVALGGGRERYIKWLKDQKDLEETDPVGVELVRNCISFIQSSVNELTWEKCLFIYFF